MRSPRAFKVTSSLDAAVTANSQTLSKEEGGVRVDLTAGGSVSDISIEVDPDILVPQVSPDGLRLAASNTSFTLSARLNGSETAAEFSVNTNAFYVMKSTSAHHRSNGCIHTRRITSRC